MLEDFLAYLKRMGSKKLSLLLSILVAFFIILSFFYVQNRSLSFSPIYGDIDMSDKADILNFFGKWNVNFIDNGEDILVDKDEIRSLRMKLASEGIPSRASIVGYEIFNKSDSFSSSSFAQDVNLLRALEGEISRTIMSFEHIKTARIHLVVPKRDVLSYNNKKATASVVLKVKDGEVLSKSDIYAISHVVSSAVVNLSVDDVTIVGTDGKAFKLGSYSDEFSSSTLQEYKFDIERRIRDSIESLVEKAVGVGGVRSEVSVELDFDKVIIDSETYDTDPVLRSAQISEEKNHAKDGATNVSVENNIPNNSQEGNVNSFSDTEKIDELRNYEISREVKKHIRSPGVIKKISVAVLIDGIYSRDPETGENVYIPRSDAEMARLRKLIVSAAGIDINRGDTIEVDNLQFIHPKVVEIEDEGFIDEEMLYNLIVVSIKSLVVFLIFIFVVKPLFKLLLDYIISNSNNQEKKSSYVDKKEFNVILNEDNLSEKSSEKELTEEEKRSKELENLNSLVSNNPEVMVDIIRGWMESDLEKDKDSN